MSEIKPDDRARREEIIETLIELEIVNLNQAQKISNIKVLHSAWFYKNRAVGRSENTGVPLVIRWAQSVPLAEIGLIDLPKSGAIVSLQLYNSAVVTNYMARF